MAAVTPERTLWVDCEFTGLSLEDDLLLEIGAVVTDGLFQSIDSYKAVISHDIGAVAMRMAQDDWWPSRGEHRNAMLSEVAQSTKTLAEVDAELVAFANCHFADRIVPAGNSLGMDRQYIARDLPGFNGLLHYRTIDVSTFKEVARRFGIEEYKKTEQHRVLADIHESIDELHYLLERLSGQAVQAPPQV